MKPVILISGISGAGKSTLAEKLRLYLQSMGREAAIIDGDSMREFFDGDYQYSSSDRLAVSKVITYGASLLASAKVDVILASMFSQPGAREFLCQKLSVLEVFLDAEIEDCIENDVKNIYRDELQKDTPDLVGHDLQFVRPSNPDLVLYTHQESVEESFEKLVSFLREKDFLGPK